MSKRAEELAYKIWDFNSESGEWPEYREAIAALIDAELRKERDRCADKAEAFLGISYTGKGLRVAIIKEPADA